MNTEDNTPTIIPEKVQAFGMRLHRMFEQYKKDRFNIEQTWLQNLRQYRGIYDPAVLARIPDDQSTAYPKFTRTKVISTVARLMEMLFPQTDKNWSVQPSPIPDLDPADLQNVLNDLSAQAKGGELTDEVIQKGVIAFATKRADAMGTRIEDVLDEIDYVMLAKKVIFSATLYNVGVLHGPLVDITSKTTYQKDPLSGQWTAKQIQVKKPFYEFVPVWEYYPDLSAKELTQQDGTFRRHIMTRAGVRDLADRPDFMRDQILQYLREHDVGNYQELHWERDLRANGDKSNVSDISGRKFELAEYWGTVTATDLIACGIEVPEDQLADVHEANVWELGGVIIKCLINPLRFKGRDDKRVRPWHTFVYEEDDISLLGNGLPVIARDSQMAICDSARMLLDNASVVCGPQYEIAANRLHPGQNLDIYARKVWIRDVQDDPNNTAPVVREITANSHIPELIEVINLFIRFLDTETALPPQTAGDTSGAGKEALRTTSNMSMMMGAAALPIRDTVRNFDKFTESFINSLYYWLIQFGGDPNIVGDFSVQAKGSTSLIAKEVRSQQLDQFRVTIRPNEEVYIDDRKLLEERMRSSDIPNDILADEDTVNERLAKQQQEHDSMLARQLKQIDATIQQIYAGAFKDVALARKADVSADAQATEAIISTMETATNGNSDNGKAGGSGSKAGGS